MGIKVRLAGDAQEEELEQNGTGEENDELALGDADDDWASLLDGEDEVVDLDADADAPSNEDAEDEQEEEAEEGEGEEQTREAISDVVPEPEASDVAEPVVQEAVVVPSIPTKSPEERAAEFAELRRGAEEELVKTFQLTEEQADNLIENPNEVLPQMMAKLYLDSYASIIQAVQANIPQMIQATMAQTQVEKTAETQFYSEWPQLNKPEYQDTLRRVADSYRVANPKATAEQFIKEVGAQGWVALRLPLDELVAHTSGKKVASPRLLPSGGRAPASPGNASLTGQAPVRRPLNEFEQMAEELLLEDD